MAKATIYHIGSLKDLESMTEETMKNAKVWSVIENYTCKGDIAKSLWESDNMTVADMDESKKWNHIIVMAGADVFIVEVSE